MALCHLFESIESELFGLDVLSLGPVDQESHELLALVLQLEDLGQEICLSLESEQGLPLEIKRLQNSLLHLLVVVWVDPVSVVQEVLLEEHT